MKLFTLFGLVFSVVLSIILLGGVVPRLLSARNDLAFAAAHGIILLYVILGVVIVYKLVEKLFLSINGR